MTRTVHHSAWRGAARALSLIVGLSLTAAGAANGQGVEAAPDSSIVVETAKAAPYGRPATVQKKVRLEGSSRNVVRSGPGDGFAIVGIFDKGTEFPVIAKSGNWFNVRVSETETGWIHASLCKELDDMSNLEFRPNPRLFSRTGSFVLTGYAAAYSFDRKSNSLALGGRLGYYIFDMLQAEGGVTWTRVQRPAEIVESLFGLTLEAEDFHMLYYNLNVTVEVLPGRQMVPYLTAGVGSSIMQGKTEASFNYGAGTMLYVARKAAIRWEVRSYRFESGPEDARVTNDNIEFSMGTSFLF
jgi:outer membrane beta-barrel protein